MTKGCTELNVVWRLDTQSDALSVGIQGIKYYIW